MAAEEENLIVVLNCSRYLTSEELVQYILGKDFPSPQKISEVADCYPWKIENKYYSADVKLLVIKKDENSGTDLPFDACKNVNAFIVIFDQIELSFKMVKKCLPCVESQDASVLLLVGSKCEPEDENEKIQALPRKQMIEWCTEHSFEFVDLNEEMDPEDDFPDTIGFDRIVQALQTTEWPILHLKESNPIASTSYDSDGKKTEEPTFPSAECPDEIFGGFTEAELDNEASFEQLFSRMKTMKEKAESLPHQERKAYAEQVAVAFWKAIGGDEDEIKDLDKN